MGPWVCSTTTNQLPHLPRLGSFAFACATTSYHLAQTKALTLLLPSGSIWHLSSDQLLRKLSYVHLRNLLLEEGLLGCRPATVGHTDTQAGRAALCLLKVLQPFGVDLANVTLTFNLWVGSRFVHIPQVPIFPKQAYRGKKYSWAAKLCFTLNDTGRAVVRLEVPPQSLTDAQIGSKTPLFVLRFMEMLTPPSSKNWNALTTPSWLARTWTAVCEATLPYTPPLSLKKLPPKSAPAMAQLHAQLIAGFPITVASVYKSKHAVHLPALSHSIYPYLITMSRVNLHRNCSRKLCHGPTGSLLCQ